MRIISQRWLTGLAAGAFAWPVCAALLLSLGIVALPGGNLGVLAAGILILIPAAACWGTYRLLLSTTLQPVGEAQRLIEAYGRLMADGNGPWSGASLPATIPEMDRAFRSLVAAGPPPDKVDALRIGFASLSDWDVELRTGDAKLGDYLRRDRLIAEWFGEAGSVKNQVGELRKGLKALRAELGAGEDRVDGSQ